MSRLRRHRASAKRRLEKLKIELARAVEAQNYEHAAELRDRIRELENRIPVWEVSRHDQVV
jgi:protein-arginine kinase activator protein McsA